MADENIAKVAADPGVPVVIHNHVDHFVMGIAFASSGTALGVEIVEVLTG